MLCKCHHTGKILKIFLKMYLMSQKLSQLISKPSKMMTTLLEFPRTSGLRTKIWIWSCSTPNQLSLRNESRIKYERHFQTCTLFCTAIQMSSSRYARSEGPKCQRKAARLRFMPCWPIRLAISWSRFVALSFFLFRFIIIIVFIIIIYLNPKYYSNGCINCWKCM